MSNTRGNSIIEVMVVIVILTIGIVGAYGIVSRWQNVARTTEKRIQAINLAREGIEAVQNIRDTNWILFSSDYTHCWMSNKYIASGCIDNIVPADSYSNGDYILMLDGNKRWILTSSPNTSIYLDANWLPEQWPASPPTTLCNTTTTKNCKTIFTRKITLSYPGVDKLKVTSLVSWRDQSSKNPHDIKLETILTNWKAK